MRRRNVLIGTFLFFLFFVFVRVASAHRPATAVPDGITIIPNIQTSYAYYEALDASNPVDIYEVSGSAGDLLHIAINIPALSGLEDYGVRLAILEPSFPELDLQALPPAVAESDLSPKGVIVESEVSADFFEPFTLTTYWGRQRFDYILPSDATYRLVVWQPDGQPGKYVMATGKAEVFGLTDIFRFPVWWVNTHLYFEHYSLLTLLGIGLGIGVVFFALRLWKPERHTLQAVKPT